MMSAALEQNDLLGRLVTRWCFSEGENAVAEGLLPPRWRRRQVAPVSLKCLTRVARADLRQFYGKLVKEDVTRSLDASFTTVDLAGAGLVTASTAGVLAREDACLASFGKAAEFGLPRLYQLPTAYCETTRRLLRREFELFPEAFAQDALATDFSPERMTRKRAELRSATHVLCPSRFVAESVRSAGVARGRILTLPLGADTGWRVPAEVPREAMLLYAGNISARKGVHRLILAWKRLGAYRACRLRLIGDMALPRQFVLEHGGCFEYVPRMPRDQLAAEYRRARAFVFNGVADGYGQVMAEAMVCGTGVLASRNSGAPELVQDGVQGRLFEFGVDGELEGVLDWALSHPTALEEMGAAARERALKWGAPEFQRAFVNWVREAIGARE